ncbi:uncharacterized protein LOC124373234 [Homalodisca vitripennis]|uniref:uncharacterized protein LOC124373234 n=1 Tax=Homalodisca vitripennis TaxID=197043 RepID=UPI001EEA5F82|nr:uncharacterized protein LOC124373234 [Homalodisca vitripennis]
MDSVGNARKWPLEKYCRWERDTKMWMDLSTEKGNCWLLLQGLEILVINKETAVESVCLTSSDVEAFYNRCHLGIAIKHKDSVSKFRITFGDTVERTKYDNCLEAVGELRKFIPVTQHKSSGGKGVQPKPNEEMSKTLNQVIKELLQTQSNVSKDTDLVLSEENIGKMIQQCLLDPNFPAHVAKVEEILSNRIGDED